MQLRNDLLKHQEGFAFIVVLSILALVTGLALVSFSTSDTDRKISSNYYETTNAYYAAEAGVVRTAAKLHDSLTWRGGYTNQAVGGGGKGTFSVVLQDSSQIPGLVDSLLVRSTGIIKSSPGSESVIEALLAPVYQNPFKWAAFGWDNVTLSGGALTDSYDSDSGAYGSQATNGPDSNGNMYASGNGDVSSNGLITLSGNTVVHGDATTSGVLDVNNGYVYGDTSSTAPPAVLDSIPTSEIDYAMANNDAPAGLTFAGSSSFNPGTKNLTASGGGASVTFTSGTYYFSSVSFSGGANIIIAPGAEVKIYVTDTWNTSGGGMVNPDGIPGNVEIYSTGTHFDFSGATGFWGAIYAPNAQITVAGGGSFYGSVLGQQIENSGGSKFHYDEALGRRPAKMLAGYRVVGWKVL